MIALTQRQIEIVERPLDARTFLEGPAGGGKTTVGVERLLHLMAEGVRADSILLIVPQRTLATPYYEALSHPGVVAGGVVSVLTVGGLAQRMVELFWPIVAEAAGFAHPDERPTFLTLETAQYFMARLVRPLLEHSSSERPPAEGPPRESPPRAGEYFDTVTISRNRLYSQILDNLNKAAVVGFPHTEIGERLKAAWNGEASQARVYADAQDCAVRFRQYCLAHNLLDFSLQLEVFIQHLWPHPLCREYLLAVYHHLIVDNVEEDTPVAHDLLRDWLPHFDSALLIHDHEAGYRRFLGADPDSGHALGALCDEQILFVESFVASPEMRELSIRLGQALNRPISAAETAPLDDGLIRAALSFEDHRYYPQMLDWVAEQIARLVFEEGSSPGEIVVLAPFLPDALRFALMNRLDRLGIPSRSHRPSRTLREEPATHCLLTLGALAHPDWGICPTKFDIAYTLIQAIEGMDLVRAQLLAGIVYRLHAGAPTLSPFEVIKPEMQERITYLLGQRYDDLRIWLEEYARWPEEAFDLFLSRLFGEVLSQEGYGFHRHYDRGEVAANLVESARKFRWTVGALGQEYVEMVQDGVVAAQYIRSWQSQPREAVFLAPAYTFLMNNRPVDYQFWLDIGSRGWFERIYQPLTHPHVLSRSWPANQKWTDAEEYETGQETLYRLVLGLLRRCRRKVYLGLSELGEQGFEQKGPLLKAIQRVLRGLPNEDAADV